MLTQVDPPFHFPSASKRSPLAICPVAFFEFMSHEEIERASFGLKFVLIYGLILFNGYRSVVWETPNGM